MASSKSTFILQFGLRKILVLHEQCPQYSDVLALGKSTFTSFSPYYNTPNAVILGGGSECPWDGNIELTQKAWEAFHTNMSHMTLVLKGDVEKLEKAT